LIGLDRGHGRGVGWIVLVGSVTIWGWCAGILGGGGPGREGWADDVGASTFDKVEGITLRAREARGLGRLAWVLCAAAEAIAVACVVLLLAGHVSFSDAANAYSGSRCPGRAAVPDWSSPRPSPLAVRVTRRR
jgi:hypothetical protein